MRDVGHMDLWGRDAIEYGLYFCRNEAIENMDKEILHAMLTDEDGSKIKELFERERHGERSLPQYVWVAVGKWQKDVAKDILDKVKKLERRGIDKEQAERNIEVRKEIDRLGDELKNIDFSSEEHKKLVQKRGNLIDELARQDVAMSFDSIPHINHFRFNDKYFNGKMPTSRKKFAVALRDLAERFLDYAKHFSEGGDTPA